MAYTVRSPYLPPETAAVKAVRSAPELPLGQDFSHKNPTADVVPYSNHRISDDKIHFQTLNCIVIIHQLFIIENIIRSYLLFSGSKRKRSLCSLNDRRAAGQRDAAPDFAAQSLRSLFHASVQWYPVVLCRGYDCIRVDSGQIQAEMTIK